MTKPLPKKTPLETSQKIHKGWLSSARQVKSPNFNQRPEGHTPRLIVIHNISLPPAQFDNEHIEQFFKNELDHSIHPYFETIKGVEVSAHLLIKRTGDVIQFVSFEDRAWHAGKSCYLGVSSCNDYSIGIELEGTDDIPFTNNQYDSLVNAILAINDTYPQTKNQLTGHSDIAPGRKTDPGEYFDWQRLRNALTED